MAERGRHERHNDDGYGVRELTSKVLQIQAKKFYLDVKENRRGRFIKISEHGATGHKSRLIIDMNTASDFHEHLTSFIELYAALGPRGRSSYADEKIKSELIYAADRRYYMDLKENARGRFLKVAMTMPPPSLERQQVVIPAQGMIDVRDALTDILSEYGASYNSDDGEEKISLEADNKMFYFNIGENQFGDYLKISEVSPSFRTAINIPHSIWQEFREKLNRVAASLPKGDSKLEAGDATQNVSAASLPVKTADVTTSSTSDVFSS